jgi:phospho-N-acetylmuramoyl-pentapeptide-transferase
MLINVIKIFLPTALAFILGVLITPIATHFFFKYKMWKKKSRSLDTSPGDFQLINKAVEDKEISVPCVGGIIIWFSVFLVTFIFFLIALFFSLDYSDVFAKLNFFSRSQTFIPIGMLILGAIMGLVDDTLEIRGKSNITRNSPWYTRLKLLIIIILGLISGSWFFYKLGMHSVHIPFGGDLELGILIIPFVVLVMLATFSGGVIDGIDGLSGGVLASIFGAYSVIAFSNNQIDIAAFCGVVTGAILAFLWFNIPPARFYMGETGMMGLTVTLATVAFLTDSVFILPIVALPLVVTSLSSSLQILSKKFRNGKKIFRVAPLHHHFEAIGWSREKITMRYWVLSVMFSIIGIILNIISR